MGKTANFERFKAPLNLRNMPISENEYPSKAKLGNLKAFLRVGVFSKRSASFLEILEVSKEMTVTSAKKSKRIVLIVG